VGTSPPGACLVPEHSSILSFDCCERKDPPVLLGPKRRVQQVDLVALLDDGPYEEMPAAKRTRRSHAVKAVGEFP
jgi:hypothetical protein